MPRINRRTRPARESFCGFIHSPKGERCSAYQSIDSFPKIGPDCGLFEPDSVLMRPNPPTWIRKLFLVDCDEKSFSVSNVTTSHYHRDIMPQGQVVLSVRESDWGVYAKKTTRFRDERWLINENSAANNKPARPKGLQNPRRGWASRILTAVEASTSRLLATLPSAVAGK